MLYFAIEMDEDKLKEKGYKVDNVYECIDAAYAQLQRRLDFIKMSELDKECEGILYG